MTAVESVWPLIRGWTRKEIEKLTRLWNQTMVDRTAELQPWVTVCEKIQKRGITQYIYANNHYAGVRRAGVGADPRQIQNVGQPR